MKKFVFGILAIIIAFSAAAFTKVAAPPECEQPLIWIQFKPNTGQKWRCDPSVSQYIYQQLSVPPTSTVVALNCQPIPYSQLGIVCAEPTPYNCLVGYRITDMIGTCPNWRPRPTAVPVCCIYRVTP
ncbi:hypothetical protein LX64_02509 [Chitinophaga skermanii]|uniref:Uncharacterized protein n=1 Tax=Chitinophaga skermanii TaxID=331697 RepID=A0A327QNX4_9BACT|nr:hypothetical protein [Chitinophaga skermanii]RAJ05352.1 hypothetical protein LX64_02509 [Chitinophaga skermanii]